MMAGYAWTNGGLLVAHHDADHLKSDIFDIGMDDWLASEQDVLDLLAAIGTYIDKRAYQGNISDTLPGVKPFHDIAHDLLPPQG